MARGYIAETISDVPGAVTPELGEVGAVSGEAVAERKDMAATGSAPERIRLTSDDVETSATAAEAQIALDEQEVSQAAHARRCHCRSVRRPLRVGNGRRTDLGIGTQRPLTNVNPTVSMNEFKLMITSPAALAHSVNTG
jgi:hypothetical protein